MSHIGLLLERLIIPEVLRAADEMVKRIPDARKTIIESTGHVPSYEQPDMFVKMLMNFLNSIK